MYPRIVSAFAVFLAVAMLSGGNARAESHPLTDFYYAEGNCVSSAHTDAFGDGKFAFAYCDDHSFRMRVFARCIDDTDTTTFEIGIIEYILEDGLRLQTALDGVETSQWGWRWSYDEETELTTLFIYPAIPTIKEALKHSRLQIRIVEGNGHIHDADIDISRFGEAIAPVRELCDW